MLFVQCRDIKQSIMPESSLLPFDLVFQVNFEALRPYMERSDLKDTNPPLLTNAELVINFAFNQKAPHRCATRSFRGQGSNSKRGAHKTVPKEDTACEYCFSDPLVEYSGRFTDIVASVDQLYLSHGRKKAARGEPRKIFRIKPFSS